MSGVGVPVLVGREGGGFTLDEAALRAVLAGPGAALPAAVLSVAGATRGGKSFLLDFCLRYLRATPTARSDGSWLGAEDEPLQGFSWRGGCDRDTIGIHIWSEPFVLTRQNGEQLAVLLMDTQGTFDSSSTVQDSTTIFAMSTLLSSLQIFNISGNIQEDHLQYLQLFTEYGKLAKEACSTPFQDLMFLVRDWSYAYQHSFGAAGGQQLLEKRLQMKESQPEELREVRQHIQACFESVRGFLMPHPGLTVATSPCFKGSLADISNEYKGALLELIPALFEEQLSLKKVHGEEVKLQELGQYFQSYMEMFNSGMMPSPVSILRATSSACLQAARAVARTVYEGQMEGSGEGRSSPSAGLRRRHAAAADAARRAFLQRRTLASPDQVAHTLDQLMQELNSQYAKFVALNEANTRLAVSASKALYNKRMLSFTDCLLPFELEIKHCAAMEEAIALFDSSRDKPNDDENDEEDVDRSNLQKELLNCLNLRDEIERNNEANINSAVDDVLERYQDEICGSQSTQNLCVVDEHLAELHSVAKRNAEELFRSKWLSEGPALNEPVDALLNKIEDRLSRLQSTNMINNEKAVDTALLFYETNMKDHIPNDRCLHPQDLSSEHRKLYRLTLAAFYRPRTYGDTWPGRDNHKIRLIQEVMKSHFNFVRLNVQKNKNAVTTAHDFYKVGMQIDGTDSLPQALGLPDLDLFRRHSVMKQQAIDKFKDQRRAGPIYIEDEFMDELIKMIDNYFTWLIFTSVSKAALTVGLCILMRRLPA